MQVHMQQFTFLVAWVMGANNHLPSPAFLTTRPTTLWEKTKSIPEIDDPTAAYYNYIQMR
jgi:hypothetical protein